MSALALICKKKGHYIEGSDTAYSEKIEMLEQAGIPVRRGHTKTDFSDVDLVVYNAAIACDNPEILAAKAASVPCIKRAQLLGRIMAEYKHGIAVSGAHGKTTATAMVVKVFSDLDPTALVGGDVPALNGSFRIGNNDEFFITEACEYKRSFLQLRPALGVILNIDEDHLDYYADINDIIDAYTDFAAGVKEDGAVIINGDDPNTVTAAIRSGHKNIITFGLDGDYDYTARDLSQTNGRYTFSVWEKDNCLGAISLITPGKHNINNALAAVACARYFGLDARTIISNLNEFMGVSRRWTKLGNLNGAEVIADYAHHPNEIKAVIDTVRQQYPKRIIAVFQPHTYTRTQKMYDKFLVALSLADETLLLPTYAAREKEIKGVNAQDLAKDLLKMGQDAKSFETFLDCAQYLKTAAIKGDMVLLLGAGDIIEMGHYLF